MMQMLQRYSLTQIVIFLVLFAIAIKSMINFWDWAKAKIRDFAKKESIYEDLRASLDEETNIRKQEMKEIKQSVFSIEKIIERLAEKVQLLLISDRDDIKSFITREYNYFVLEKGEIDHYSLQAIEKRYDHYIEEGGNSYVGDLMSALRALPRVAPRK